MLYVYQDRRRKNAEGGDDAVMQKVDQRQPLSEIFVSTTNLYGETDSPDMIAYDDPEERMAKRKLLEEVQKNNKKIKSDQEEAITAAEASAARATVSAPLVSTNTSDSISSSRHHEPSEQLQPSNTITTSINTSLSLKQDRNPTMGIPSSSSWSVIPEQQSRTTKLANTRNYVFCMSGVKRNVKVLSAGISNLGGVLLDDDTWGKGFTHLICDKPTKTGKCLAAIACGSWVLRPSFVLDSVENGAWLPEEQYEWAGDTTRKPLGKIIYYDAVYTHTLSLSDISST